MSITYSQDIVSPPEHLSLEFFEEVLENAVQRANLQLENVVFTMGSSIGENYCSLIYRVQLHYRIKNSSTLDQLAVIIKSMPITSANDFLVDLEVFIKEKSTFYNILPRLELFMDRGERFGPRIYHHLRKPVNTLVFEDLKEQEFVMADREIGLDMLHATIVIERLAKLHAISMHLVKKNPNAMESYDAGMLGASAIKKDNSFLIRYFECLLGCLMERTSTWKGFEIITQKLQKYQKNLQNELVAAQQPKSNELKVLNHGDLWVNNILFKYDKQQNPIDVIFVDYQMSIWSSPGLDLNYFFNTSLQLDVLKTQREQLIKIYYKALCVKLHELDYTTLPTEQQIREEVRQREAFGFFANFAIYPLICMDRNISGDSSIENLDNQDFALQKARQMFSSKRLQENMQYTLKRFEELGIWN